ncbi:SRPBCC family protein [Flavobacterium sp. W1B]|uniref:SRPBCC family protein n=1 Tax=Flavobacterium sp. W1B TaxID=3394146 RepID=UPI0039BD3875
MRILKYIFLLLLLSLVALTIFIATQKGDFTVERSRIINSPKSAVFNYVNDYRNWADFGSWTLQDPEIKINYSQNTIGKDASYSWEGKDTNGEIQTLYAKENDSISQKVDSEGTISSIQWIFKDTIGGTKVTWKTKGKMSFFFKIYTALNGGADKVIGTIYEKTLINLDKALVYEINTYSIKENGLVRKPLSFYLCQTFTSEIAKINKNFKIVTPKIIDFCKDNNIAMSGKPFVIYHTYDAQKGLARVSIGVPIKNEIFISAGSDIASGKLEAFEAVKTTLTGDYSHLKKAYNKTVEYLIKNQISHAPLISHIEVYTIGKDEAKKPSEWVTEIYMPIIPKVAPVINTPTQTVLQTGDIDEDPTISNSVEPIKRNKTVLKSTEPKKVPAPKTTEEGQSEF